MPATGSGVTPGPTDFLLAQAARAKSVRLSAALVFLRRMVSEIIVAFLGTLPLDQHPESKPFTPSTPAVGRTVSITPGGRAFIPDAPEPSVPGASGSAAAQDAVGEG